ncbi:DUF7309 domain-containing protein [Alicyclobacillus acidocaldarius]|uniref:DUF7309 domain-containing protein n=1 Tax=Alicyclobacillus acidocaldarius TaxID=405212 RepID=UPI004045A990
MAPWQWKHDDALFAAEDPDTAEIRYCSMMGALGEFHGLAVFPGEAGWRSLQLLRDDDDSYQAEEQRSEASLTMLQSLR